MKYPGWRIFAFVILSLGGAADAQDVIFLKNGESAACEIEALTDNIVTFSLVSERGESSASRTIPMDRVEYVEFDFEAGEEDQFERRSELDVETTKRWWDLCFAHLHRPRSRAASWGIAYAHSLLRDDPERFGEQALRLFERVAERAWGPGDIAAAKRGRLQALIALGELERATGEALVLASETEDPELLIEVKYLLAQADFAKLEALEEEHPRWDEDDEVRPERNRLYHSTIDQFLWPHLFHASREGAASRGLLAAGEVYEFGEDRTRAADVYRDLTKLYPNSEVSRESSARLSRLSDTPENL